MMANRNRSIAWLTNWLLSIICPTFTVGLWLSIAIFSSNSQRNSWDWVSAIKSWFCKEGDDVTKMQCNATGRILFVCSNLLKWFFSQFISQLNYTVLIKRGFTKIPTHLLSHTQAQLSRKLYGAESIVLLLLYWSVHKIDLANTNTETRSIVSSGYFLTSRIECSGHMVWHYST